jgi:hypothetical protein
LVLALRKYVLQPVFYVWAAPATSIGLAFGAVGLLSGGKTRVNTGVIEFHGGLVKRWLILCGASAMTLGHVVLGQTDSDLEWTRDHERVHVKQYERWGPLFLPLYFGWAGYLYLSGKHYYLDIPFEVEARRLSGK